MIRTSRSVERRRVSVQKYYEVRETSVSVVTTQDYTEIGRQKDIAHLFVDSVPIHGPV